MSKSLLYILFGEALLVGAFFAFLYPLGEQNIFYLNLVMAMLLLFVLMTPFADFTKTTNAFTSTLASLGQRWGAITLFELLGIAIIVTSFVLKMEFTTVLILHLFNIFLYVGSIMVSGFMNKSFVNTEEKNIVRKQKLGEIKSNLQMLGIVLDENERYKSSCDKVAKLVEEIRYITPSDTIEAISWEDKILAQISDIIFTARSGATTPEDIDKKTNECLKLIAIRKTIK